MTTIELIKESLKIEDIYREPRPAEVAAWTAFMRLDDVTVGDLVVFVDIYGNYILDSPQGKELGMSQLKAAI
ncbi:MAG TPA: hypothetical protein ENI27_03385 [bacterium]|nr:hypothetical protein [bacterium]